MTRLTILHALLPHFTVSLVFCPSLALAIDFQLLKLNFGIDRNRTRLKIFAFGLKTTNHEEKREKQVSFILYKLLFGVLIILNIILFRPAFIRISLCLNSKGSSTRNLVLSLEHKKELPLRL